MRTQEVTDYLGENSDLAREVAKKSFKACRQGKIPVALAAIGVATATGIVAAEIIDNTSIPDVIPDLIIDSVCDLF